MNLSPDDCKEWKKNPLINPKTHRTIKHSGPVYKKIEKACETEPINHNDCEAWKKDKTRHPVTKRKLKMNAKNGLYTQLVKLCETPIIKGRLSTSKTPIIEENLEKQREKLIEEVKKVIVPLLHKADTTQTRIQFSKIINNYISTITPCITEIDDKLCLIDKQKNKIIYFDKRIGRESVYGMAYMNMGKGLAKLLKFSCKLMSSNLKGNKLEVELLDKMTQAVFNNICPNMPITYKTIKCTKKCKIDECPLVVKKSSYFVVINELANYDIQSWFKETHSREAYESVIMQLIMSIYCFHGLGYSHNDCHLGNFLIHKIKPGGCWRYNIHGENVYVPNHGYLLVMWDPGQSTKTVIDFTRDYIQPLTLISNMEKYKAYIGMKKPPVHTVDYGIVPIMNTIVYSYENEADTFKQILTHIKTNVIQFSSIVVGGKPPTHLLNVKPYTLV